MVLIPLYAIKIGTRNVMPPSAAPYKLDNRPLAFSGNRVAVSHLCNANYLYIIISRNRRHFIQRMHIES